LFFSEIKFLKDFIKKKVIINEKLEKVKRGEPLPEPPDIVE